MVAATMAVAAMMVLVAMTAVVVDAAVARTTNCHAFDVHPRTTYNCQQRLAQQFRNPLFPMKSPTKR